MVIRSDVRLGLGLELGLELSSVRVAVTREKAMESAVAAVAAVALRSTADPSGWGLSEG